MTDRLFYLHGFASGPGSKKAEFFRDRCAEIGRDLLIPDLAGGDFESMTISTQLAIIDAAVADAPSVLFGSSMGGYLAALYAARHTSVRKLILMAPAFGFARRWPESLGQERVAEWQRSGSLSVFHYGDRRERRIGYALLEDGAQYEDFPEVTQPTLIFHGLADDIVPAAYSQTFAAGRPNVTLDLLASDHELLDVLNHMWRRTRDFLA